MKKIRAALDKLGYDELVFLQKDLFNGGLKARSMVSDRLRELEESENRICATCGNSVNVADAENFTITFGPSSLKKKASFCAVDCLEYFFTNLKAFSAKSIQQ